MVSRAAAVCRVGGLGADGDAWSGTWPVALVGTHALRQPGARAAAPPHTCAPCRTLMMTTGPRCMTSSRWGLGDAREHGSAQTSISCRWYTEGGNMQGTARG